MSIQARFSIRRENFLLDVDLDIPSLGITAIFGPSGCGKTTLLRAIAGLEKVHSGYLAINANTWQDDKLFVPAHRRRVGFVFQEPSLFEHLNVRSNLQYGLKRIPANQRRVSLQSAIELLGIEPLLDRTVGQLSGGEQQRVAIARALAVSPEILLMDEPLSALDVKRKHEILPYLESLHNELRIPVLYVSHSPEEVSRLADQLLLMENGRLIAQGNVMQILTRLDLPLAQGDEAAAVIQATVLEHDDQFNLTELAFSGGRITVARQALKLQQPVRLRIAARDVSLTLEHQSGTSILNIFPVTVMGLKSENNAQTMVQLDAGGSPLLARVTHKSASLLGLEPGKKVFAQVKSVALLN